MVTSLGTSEINLSIHHLAIDPSAEALRILAWERRLELSHEFDLVLVVEETLVTLRVGSFCRQKCGVAKGCSARCLIIAD